MNLILAIVWFCLGVSLLVSQQLGDAPTWYLPVFGMRIPAVLMFFVFAAFNVVRWATVRGDRSRRALARSLARRPTRRPSDDQPIREDLVFPPPPDEAGRPPG